MANHNVGSLIKRLRKQKGLTQEELAYPMIDRATLSKIESGKAMPSNKTLETLFEKLGYNPNKMTDFFHDEEMSDAKKILNELNGILVFQTLDPESPVVARVDSLISQLENNEKYTQSELNRQKISILKASNAINKRVAPSTVRAMLLDAIKMTIPIFDVKNIGDYYLSKQDQQIINMLAISYDEEQQHDKAIEIMYGLKHNYDMHCIDIREMGDHYPALIYSLAKFLLAAGKPNEAIELCEVALKVGKETRSLHRLPYIMGMKATGLAALGKIEESKRLFLQIINAFELFEMHDEVIMVKEYAKETLGIDL